MESNRLKDSLSLIADFYDSCKYGCEGFEGYRKSTDLRKFIVCVEELRSLGFIDPEKTIFADLGCADGRVNVLMSYFVRKSIGIEIDAEILAEYSTRSAELGSLLREKGLKLPPENVFLYAGSSLDSDTYRRVSSETGARFDDVDLFYTYITLHDVFSEKIAEEARHGALYLVYGFNKVLPRYEGLKLVVPDVASQGIAALYAKE